MTEIMYFPFMVFIIVFTAILSSIVTTSLPYMPKYWYALKNAIKRVFTTRATTPSSDIDNLKKEVNNIAEKLATREKHLKGNIRRYVREYLEELKND